MGAWLLCAVSGKRSVDHNGVQLDPLLLTCSQESCEGCAVILYDNI